MPSGTSPSICQGLFLPKSLHEVAEVTPWCIWLASQCMMSPDCWTLLWTRRVGGKNVRRNWNHWEWDGSIYWSLGAAFIVRCFPLHFLAMAANARATATSSKSLDSGPRFGCILVFMAAAMLILPCDTGLPGDEVLNRNDWRHIREVELRQVGEAILRTALRKQPFCWPWPLCLMGVPLTI